MAIVKMKYVNIMGKIDDFDRVATKYIASQEIHLENALNELHNVVGLHTFNDTNPYLPLIKQLEALFLSTEIPLEKVANPTMSLTEAMGVIQTAISTTNEYMEIRTQCSNNAAELMEKREQIAPLQGMEFDMQKLWSFEFIKVRVGKFPRKNSASLEALLSDRSEVIFVPCRVANDFVWGIYFMPEPFADRVDSIFASMHFERYKVSDEFVGTPAECYKNLSRQIEENMQKSNEVTQKASEYIKQSSAQLAEAYSSLFFANECFNVRKFAGRTSSKFYIVGWMPEDEIPQLVKKIDQEADVVCIVEDKDTVFASTPPTKLRNWKIFRPFEMFVELYGLPFYDEIDPTVFIAVIYSVLFGMMFGDVGHGFILALAGFLYYRASKNNLGAIIGVVGCFSMIFGFLYGSILGNEEILQTSVIKPSHDIISILLIAVAFGVALILVAMLLNIINNLRRHDWVNALCGPNGLSGLMFYTVLIFGLILPIFGLNFIPMPVVYLLIFITLILVVAQHPLHAMVHGESPFPEGAGSFFLTAFFELFEVLLSYVTNTVSFVRVGAFALAHGGMMSVVFILMGMTHSLERTTVDLFGTEFLMGDTLSWVISAIIFVLGNLLVLGLEGLVVGIQALRLDFYEMFSRFYGGGGRRFESLKSSLLR